LEPTRRADTEHCSMKWRYTIGMAALVAAAIIAYYISL
jgi:hypothetical protein